MAENNEDTTLVRSPNSTRTITEKARMAQEQKPSGLGNVSVEMCLLRGGVSVSVVQPRQ